MNRHCFMLISFCFLSLTGCATESIQQQQFTLSHEAIQAQSFMQSGQHKQAAKLYQTLAKSEFSQQDQYNLLAAEAFITSGDSQTAQTLVDIISPSALSVEQRHRLNLLSAQISLSGGEAEKALNQLSIIPSYKLKLKNKIIFFKSLAFAHSLAGHILQSVQARIQLTPLLENSQQRQSNNNVILNTLNLLSTQTLTLRQPPAPDVLGGWMSLTRLLKTRKTSHNRTAFQYNLDEWKRLFPHHPASYEFIPTFSQKSVSHSFNQASAIALFLPESGRHARAAQVIKEGFKVAYQNAIYQPALRFYDSSAGNIINLYHQAIAEGAELIIGPLSKDKIQNLALSTELTTPVMALNHVTNLSKNNLFQFGLSPIDDAIQISTKAKNEGHQKILLLTPESKQGQRAATHITEYWEDNGGEVLEAQTYKSKGNDFTAPIKELLNLYESKHRYNKLKRLLGTNIDFTERRRQDVDAIFLYAFPRTARSIYPQLRFYRATRIPVYSPSQIYSGRPNQSQDLDLSSITFCDIPWLFNDSYQGELGLSSLKNIWEQFPDKYIRLFALGIDSFNIIDHLSQLHSTPYAGATGFLSVNLENRITRELVCAKFIDGSPVLQDFIADNITFDQNTVYSEDEMQ